MHELKLIQDLLRAALAAANGKNIKVVRIKVGEHCHAAQESVEFLFKAAARSTLADKAKLELTVIPGEDLILDSIQI